MVAVAGYQFYTGTTGYYPPSNTTGDYLYVTYGSSCDITIEYNPVKPIKESDRQRLLLIENFYSYFLDSLEIFADALPFVLPDIPKVFIPLRFGARAPPPPPPASADRYT